MKYLVALLVGTVLMAVTVQAGESCCSTKAKAKSAKKADTSVRGSQLLVKK